MTHGIYYTVNSSSGPLNITFVVNKLNTVEGGGSNQTLSLLASLQQKVGHKVRILTLQPERNNIAEETDFDILEADVPNIPLRIGNAVGLSHVLSRYESTTDIYQFLHPMYSGGGGLYRKLGGEVPVIGYLGRYYFCSNNCKMDGVCHESCTSTAKFLHSDEPLSNRIAKYPLYAYTTHLEPILYNYVDHFITIGPRSKEIFEANGIPSERTTVIPLCKDPEFETDSSADDQKGQFTVLYVGQLLELKGVDVLIDAVDQLDSTIRVDIVGDGPEMSNLKTKVEELDLDDQISFHGHIPNNEVPIFYKESDIFVHPSRFPDPGTRTVLEAIQNGTPPIVSDTGDPPWLVGEAGLVFDTGDAISLAENISLLIDNDKLLNDLKGACVKRSEDFNPLTTQRKFENLYRDLAEGV